MRECAIFVSVQYRKILHTYVTFIYMGIYFSHVINKCITHKLSNTFGKWDALQMS